MNKEQQANGQSMEKQAQHEHALDMNEEQVYRDTDRVGAPRRDVLESQVATEMLEEMPSYMARGFIYLMVLVVIGGIIYAYFGKMDVVIQGQGKLIPQGSSEIVQAAKEGMLKKLYVKEGGRVEKGQLLAELDVTRTNLDVKKRARQYRQLLKQKECLDLASEGMDAVRFGQDIHIDREKILAICDSQYVEQILGLKETRQQYEQWQLKSREIIPLDIKNLEEQVKTRQSNLEQKTRELEAARRDLKRNTDQLALYREMFSQGLASKVKLLEEQKAYDEAMTKGAKAEVELRSAADSLAEAKASLKTKRLEASAEKALAEEKLRTAYLRYESVKNSLNLEQEAIADRIADFDLDTKLFDYTNKFDRITAPVAGTIVEVALKTPGELVQAGRTIFLINPANQPLVAQVLVPNKSVGRLTPGLQTKLKFDAYPYQNYGVLPGRILRISADSKLVGNASYFEITVSLERDYLLRNGQRYDLFPGLTMLAEVVVEQRRIIDNFLDPLRKLKG